DSITVAYVSPLVLRKELENMLDNDGDAALQNPDIVHQKDIIFWNMMWIFKRLELPSHLPELILPNYPGDRNDKFDVCAIPDLFQVLMSTSWDSDRQDCDFVPMYVLWNSPMSTNFPLNHFIRIQRLQASRRKLLRSVVAHIQINDVDSPITILLDERNRQSHSSYRSVYRELLFLSLTACGSEHIDVEAYDREYRKSYKRIVENKEYVDKLCTEDKPPSARVVFCRRLFTPPALQPRLPHFLNNMNLL
ncbi:predicted protein, partial [Nematostella vectensis]